MLAHTTELVVSTASPRAGLQASEAGGENYKYKSGNIEPSEYTANIGAGSEGYRAGGGLGKCKSWSLSKWAGGGYCK